MNYLVAIDDEITKLEMRLSQLQIAREVIVHISKPKQAAKVDRPHTKGGASDRARKLIISYLRTVTEPVKARMISEMLHGYGIKDTTMWNVTKVLRDEGIIAWDKDERLYSLAREEDAA